MRFLYTDFSLWKEKKSKQLMYQTMKEKEDALIRNSIQNFIFNILDVQKKKKKKDMMIIILKWS